METTKLDLIRSKLLDYHKDFLVVINFYNQGFEAFLKGLIQLTQYDRLYIFLKIYSLLKNHLAHIKLHDYQHFQTEKVHELILIIYL